MQVFPNEMMASFWSGVLREEGIGTVMKPLMGGYGMWGHDSFIPHGLYTITELVDRARQLLAEGDDT